jgi:hypothetical protein
LNILQREYLFAVILTTRRPQRYKPICTGLEPKIQRPLNVEIVNDIAEQMGNNVVGSSHPNL